MKKIFFSLKPPSGSYGGGAFFVKNLCNYLTKKGHNVVYDLDSDIDVIFIIDPRKDMYNKYHLNDIIMYKKKYPNVKIIYRVNECDIKREVSINLEPLLVKTMAIADHVVFISNWLQNYFIKKYSLNLPSYNCILNGCNKEHFFPENKKNQYNKIKIVTHHWSNNYLKGFHIYNELDKILPSLKNIEFTFIGNYNKNYQPKNIKLISPKNGKDLGDIIKQHNIYITATQNEPCGMHHIEGLSCGLPILYCKGGGAIKEVCEGVGEEFENIDDLIVKLNKIMNNYDKYVKNINYDYLSGDRCCEEYYKIINNL
jgi:glycosyltransferase involved in cell wall biosynthesis